MTEHSKIVDELDDKFINGFLDKLFIALSNTTSKQALCTLYQNGTIEKSSNDGYIGSGIYNVDKINEFIQNVCGLRFQCGRHAEGIMFTNDAQDIYNQTLSYYEENNEKYMLSYFHKYCIEPCHIATKFVSLHTYVIWDCDDGRFIVFKPVTDNVPSFTLRDVQKHFDISDAKMEEYKKTFNLC